MFMQFTYAHCMLFFSYRFLYIRSTFPSPSSMFFYNLLLGSEERYTSRDVTFQLQATASIVGRGLQLTGFWLIAQPLSSPSVNTCFACSITGHIWQGGAPQGGWLRREGVCGSGVRCWRKSGWVKSWLQNCNINMSRQANEGLQFADAHLTLSPFKEDSIC